MKIFSSIDGSQLLEFKVEGEVRIDPAEARELLDSLATCGFGDQVVLRVGAVKEWTKLNSRWGGAARFSVIENENVVPSQGTGA